MAAPTGLNRWQRAAGLALLAAWLAGDALLRSALVPDCLPPGACRPDPGPPWLGPVAVLWKWAPLVALWAWLRRR